MLSKNAFIFIVVLVIIIVIGASCLRNSGGQRENASHAPPSAPPINRNTTPVSSPPYTLISTPENPRREYTSPQIPPVRVATGYDSSFYGQDPASDRFGRGPGASDKTTDEWTLL